MSGQLKQGAARLALGAMLLVGSVVPAAARSGGACPSDQEVEAEGAVRLHTQLMVTAYSCAGFRVGGDLIGKYQAFTQRNARRIAKAETQMISSFKARFGGGAERRLHDTRTQLANELSAAVANLTPPVYCQRALGMLDTALGLDEAALDQSVHAFAIQVKRPPGCKPR